MSNHFSHRNAVLLMVCAATLWSIAGVLTRHLEAARDFEVTFWRSMFAALFVGMLLLWEHRGDAIAKIRSMGRLGLLSGLTWSVMFGSFMLAMTMTTVANTLIVMSITPLFTAFLAWLILHQRIAPRTWFAIALASAGIAGMFASSMSQIDARGLTGMLVAFGMPVGASVNTILMKRAGKTVDLIPAVFLGGVICALLMLPFALPLQATAHDMGIVATLGFFQLGLPCMLMVKAAKTLSAPEIALIALLEVLLGPIWAWLGAGEVPAQATLAGGAVVLFALAYNAVGGIKRPVRLA
jgi:drug/metabolite transporter (DMT)-like permease